MIKRTIIISSPSYCFLKNKQLVIDRKDESIATVPIEDIGYIEFNTMQATITTSLIEELTKNNCVVVFVDSTHHPSGILTSVEGNTLHAERIQAQAKLTETKKRQLWQMIIKAKILNQALALQELGIVAARLQKLKNEVLSGDSRNCEGVAARHYWQLLLKPFGVRRMPDGSHPNPMLNYGYAVLRASVARALVGSGLHPALGIKHTNKYNAFALADDVMEPFRPFVDVCVLPLALDDPEGELTPETKSKILQVLVSDTFYKIGRRPLLNALSLSAASISQQISGAKVEQIFPRLCE